MLNAAPPRAGIPIPEAKRTFEPETANLFPFSWGSKGDILFPRKENIPLHRSPCTAQEGTNAALSRCHIFYSALGSFAAGFISSAQMTIARIVFGSMYVPLYSME